MNQLVVSVGIVVFAFSLLGDALKNGSESETKGKVLASKYPDGSKAGIVEQPGSQKGLFVIVNTQKDLPTEQLDIVSKQIAKEFLIKVEVKESVAAEPSGLIRKFGGSLGIVVVSDDATPTMLVAPEDGWAVVNVKKLDNFATPESKSKSYADRCRRELVRAFVQVSGGWGSTYFGNICSVVKIDELELVPEGIPNDRLVAIQRFFKEKGITPIRRVPYIKACKEGWAHAPTNDAQRAIWDRLHEIPSEPMVIKPEKHPAK